MIRVVLPYHLQMLAKVRSEVQLDVNDPVTQDSVLTALEVQFPMLEGTMREHVSKRRRPFVRFFACGQDLSHELPDALLPVDVRSGSEPFLIVGAVAGG